MSSDPDGTIQLNSFNGVLDEVEKGEHLTPEQRIKQLTKFIGGFEKWSQLNEDCRLYIVQCLDYKSRCQLERCSKQDQSTVKSTPIHVHNIVIFYSKLCPDWYGDEPFNNVQVEVEFGNSTRNYSLVFSQDGENTKRQWLKYFPRKEPKVQTLVIKGSNYYEEAIKFAEGFMKKGNFEMDRICISMSRYPCETSQVRPMPFCKNARIGVTSLEQLGWWLSKLPEDMDRLYLYSNEEGSDEFVFPSQSLDVPQVRRAKLLSVSGKVGFTDRQVLSLTNRSIYLEDVSVSDETLNQLIKRWINGNCYKGFEQAHLGSIKDRSLDVILDGIQVVEWDEDFREKVGFFYSEFHRFCGGGGVSYQISSRVDPYESLTLNCFDDGFYLYHTGKRAIYNGESVEEYFVPRGYW